MLCGDYRHMSYRGIQDKPFDGVDAKSPFMILKVVQSLRLKSWPWHFMMDLHNIGRGWLYGPLLSVRSFVDDL